MRLASIKMLDGMIRLLRIMRLACIKRLDRMIRLAEDNPVRLANIKMLECGARISDLPISI